jgi:hypothetical protein
MKICRSGDELVLSHSLSVGYIFVQYATYEVFKTS